MVMAQDAVAAIKKYEPLDFVYIDARHDYCGCLADIQSYWEILKPCGIMAGHDYMTAAEHKKHIPTDVSKRHA